MLHAKAKFLRRINITSRPGFEPGLKALCAKMLRRPPGYPLPHRDKNTSDGMLQVIKLIGMMLWSVPS